jgi:hypothetical protein
MNHELSEGRMAQNQNEAARYGVGGSLWLMDVVQMSRLEFAMISVLGCGMIVLSHWI